jgi:uncharacterized protein
MKFENAFDVQAPIDEVYATMLDIERVAPCLPGAQVLEKTGDASYKVAVKIKLGPISMQYRGDVEVIERDDDAHRAVLSIKAREARGQGTADASTEVALRNGDGDGATHAVLSADVQLSGKAAAMGQGVIQDVSARLVDQFAANLAAMLEGGGEAAGVAAVSEPLSAPGAAAGAPSAAPAEPAAASSAGGAEQPPPLRQAPPPAGDDALSAADLAGAVIVGRLRDPKAIAGLVVAILTLLVLLRRRRR